MGIGLRGSEETIELLGVIDTPRVGGGALAGTSDHPNSAASRAASENAEGWVSVSPVCGDEGISGIV